MNTTHWDTTRDVRRLPAIHDKLTPFTFSPFNLLKGVLFTLLVLPLYKHVSLLLHRVLPTSRP